MATLQAPKPTRLRTVTGAGRRNTGAERKSWRITTVLAVLSLTVILPLYLAVVMSLKTDQQAASGNGFALPHPFDFSNFKTAWNLVHFPRAVLISVLIAIIAVAGQLAISSMASYAIVRNWDRKA